LQPKATSSLPHQFPLAQGLCYFVTPLHVLNLMMGKIIAILMWNVVIGLVVFFDGDYNSV